eukprot:CAMPEP_0183515666 /NCGR_PEP_ID=MMETSP0371-20130417/13672_1 /TAXON_ID=268820 /ORGANISM="Peridinium aciculiferum, Strain PAER-2" /LENGTH=32 /DNA_ID= /DNA_START= /DNA_END= /DNA_ORIENTATION=
MSGSTQDSAMSSSNLEARPMAQDLAHASSIVL